MILDFRKVIDKSIYFYNIESLLGLKSKQDIETDDEYAVIKYNAEIITRESSMEIVPWISDVSISFTYRVYIEDLSFDEIDYFIKNLGCGKRGEYLEGEYETTLDNNEWKFEGLEIKDNMLYINDIDDIDFKTKIIEFN